MNETSASAQKTSDTPLSSSSSTSSPSEGLPQTSHTSSSHSLPLGAAASKERLSSEVNEAIQKFEEVSLNEFQRLENIGIDPESAVSKIMHNLQQKHQQLQASAQKQLREEEIEKIRELTGFDKTMATRVLVLRNELAQLKRKGAVNTAVALSQLTERITHPASSAPTNSSNDGGSPSQPSSLSGSHEGSERSAGGGGSSKKRRRSQRFQSRKSRKTDTGDQDSTIDETNVNKGSDDPSLGTDDNVSDDSSLRKRHWTEAELDQKPAKKQRKTLSSSSSSSSLSSSTSDSPEFRVSSRLSDMELSVGSESSSTTMDNELSTSLQTQPQSLWYSPNSSTHSTTAFSANPARANSGTNASSIFGAAVTSASTTTPDSSIASSSSTSSPSNQAASMPASIPFAPQFSTAARFPSIPNLLNTTTATSTTASSNSTTSTSSTTTTTTNTDSNNSIYNKSGIILGAGIDMTGL